MFFFFKVCGAPDPTAGASVSDQTSWYLDQKTLHDNIKKILIKFCVPSPMVFRLVDIVTYKSNELCLLYKFFLIYIISVFLKFYY